MTKVETIANQTFEHYAKNTSN